MTEANRRQAETTRNHLLRTDALARRSFALLSSLPGAIPCKWAGRCLWTCGNHDVVMCEKSTNERPGNRRDNELTPKAPRPAAEGRRLADLDHGGCAV